jgi:gliding motility-associated-like protein
VLQWSIDNGPCGTSTDEMTIMLWDGSVPPAYAGEDQHFCEDTTETTMHAAPAFSTATAVWTLLSGSGTIDEPIDSLTAITGLQLGPNIFLWTVFNGECGTTADSLVITIEDCTDFIVPDAFSPNDDGRNDTYVISGLEDYPDAHLQVFNRWGSQVLDRQPYLNNWDGRSENSMNFGDELPESTYYYILDLGDGSDVLTGYIYLRR